MAVGFIILTQQVQNDRTFSLFDLSQHFSLNYFAFSMTALLPATIESLEWIKKMEPNHTRQPDPEPLLVRPMTYTYTEVYTTICKINIGQPGAKVERLPPELAKGIMQYITIKRVEPNSVEALEASSHDKVHPLACCLFGDEQTWWLSGFQSMPHGRGKQWVQFALGPTMRRLSTVFVKIPPLPQGPLSVKDFVIQKFSILRGWHDTSPIFVCQNRTGWQRFDLPEPVDVQEVRVVCLSNQISAYLDRESSIVPAAQTRRLESVGFFSIRFE